ncbi:MAG: DUF3990 domain-containing protein [Kiritimatiellae bacterium]|nr:DUF3990 domain-containing protein [Kiritimatiellia bacterium]
MKIFHGSQSVIKVPQYGLGKVGNDFGLGFYCTESEDLAKEWSVQPNSDGFANAYELDMKGLNVLRLNTPEFTVLNWMAILVSHRQFKLKVPVAGAAYHYLKSRFAVNVDAYDVVIGYRADDSYFDFAEAFLNNSISVEQLAVALRLGKLGEQVVIKSQEAFGRIRFTGFSTAASALYYPRRQARNDSAGREFEELLSRNDFNGLYMNAILAQRIGNDDERIPRNIAP